MSPSRLPFIPALGLVSALTLGPCAISMLPVDVHAAPLKIWELRADEANGTAAYTTASSSDPWVDLVGGHDGALEGFLATGGSGWEGNGSHAQPFGLYWDGGERRVVVPAGSIEALQDSTQNVTVGMWFKTGFDGANSRFEYLMEWVQGASLDPDYDGGGMSIAIQQGALQVYEGEWVSAGAVEPNQWYHVMVTKAPGDLRVYLNGQRAYTGTHALMGAQRSPLSLGCSSYRYFLGYPGEAAFGEYWTGTIAQAEIWQGAMTDSEATDAFRADSALYLPSEPVAAGLDKVVELRAGVANGTAPYTIPGNEGPWTDLAGTAQSAVLQDVAGTDSTSGWAGLGTPSSPYRLQMDGVDDVLSIAPASIPELQARTETTTEMWFQTGPDVASSTRRYLVEWVAGYDANGGLALSVADGSLQVYTRVPYWQPVAGVAANTWYHVAVVKHVGGVQVYVNGAPAYAGPMALAGGQGTEVVLGASTYRGAQNYGEYWDGAIGQFTLWRGAKDANAVLDSYRADSASYVVSWPISASANPNGSIQPAGVVNVAMGGSLAFTITPDAGYSVQDVMVDGVSVGAVTSYSFANVTGSHTITATFSTGVLAVGPSDFRLALIGASPNPTRVRMRVSFSLPAPGPATLELIDLGGRRVRRAEVGSLGPGLHSIDLSQGRMPAPGLYWIRLAHGGQMLVARVAVMS